MKESEFLINGMTCTACEKHVRDAVSKINGIKKINISIISGIMKIEHSDNVTPKKIINAVKKAGYGAELRAPNNNFKEEWNIRENKITNNLKTMQYRLISSLILLAPLLYISMGGMLNLPYSDLGGNTLLSVTIQVILTSCIVFINKHFYISGFRALYQKSPNMDTLVSIGSLSAFLYGLWICIKIFASAQIGDLQAITKYSHMLYLESAATILTLVTVGKYLETVSKNKTSDVLSRLVNLTPQTAIVERNGKELSIPAEEISVNDIVLIKPGQIIPADGIVIEGRGFVDQAAITGESMPVEKNPGDKVISPAVNKNGSFKFRAVKVGNNTTFAQIIKLVDEAESTKAPIARIADRVSGVFVPIVLLITFVTIIAWLIAGESFEFALNCAISVLVISCPCALGLATPAAITVGIGKAAEHGVLIKSAETLEKLHSIDTIALDKTGTVTNGTPEVSDTQVYSENLNKNSLISIAASIEANSEHPIAAAIVNYAKEKGIEFTTPSTIEVIPGMGVSTIINNIKYFAGNKEFIYKNCCNVPNIINPKNKTQVFISDNNNLLGVITITDTIRTSAKAAILKLKKLGLNIILLTGDNKFTAETVSKETGIDKFFSELLPQDKNKIIKDLQKAGCNVMMIGDGINDAPALATADIGAAIGSGTDIAIDAADIILIKNSLEDAVFSINLSHAVIKNIKENLFWAFFYNILGIPIAAGVLFPLFGIVLTPMVAAAAMSFSSVSVVLNALRLKFFNNRLNRKKNIKPIKNIDLGETKMKVIELNIEGMMCAHCQNRVPKTLESISGVENVTVNLEDKTATVTCNDNINPTILTEAIKKDGYNTVSYKLI